ncbi:MTAP family purine nucleoside phosphorylase [Candidatus Woesearchaeota archaeon]|nr:MTAP family purine nucleoside phosphorylase [Candidatus Woesearchaeota archaeon]
MARIGFIIGSGFSGEGALEGAEQRIIKTQYGNVFLYQKGKVVFLPRHGKGKNIPPHRVNHRANICALNLHGVEKIVGINSVGSLKESIKPGTIVAPSDYVHFSPPTFFDFELRFIIPQLDQALIGEIAAASKKTKIAVKKSGIYVQTRGPRLETKAEIKIISKWGDIVGMTMASEATLAQELGIKYAAICSVDNYANGIREIKTQEFSKMRERNQPRLEKIMKEMARRNSA